MVSPLPSWMLILSIDFVPREQAGKKFKKKLVKLILFLYLSHISLAWYFISLKLFLPLYIEQKIMLKQSFFW